MRLSFFHTNTWKHRRYKIIPACFHPIILHSTAICDTRIHAECLHLSMKWTRIAPCTHSRKTAPLTEKLPHFSFIHRVTSLSLAWYSPKNKSGEREIYVVHTFKYTFSDFSQWFSLLADVKHFNRISRNVLVFIHCQHTNTQTGFLKNTRSEEKENIKLLFDNGIESRERVRAISLIFLNPEKK